jgi:hypothetical protein
MRKQRLIQGLNNSPEIRFIVDGVGMYCRISQMWKTLPPTPPSRL